MRPLAALVLLLALTGPAEAATTVLAFGDSNTFGFAQNGGWPAVVQAQRPDLHLVNGGLPGDTSASRDRLRALLDLWHPTVVVVMMGTNDPIEIHGISPEASARNIRRLALAARNAGARVVVLTPPPAGCLFWGPFFDNFCETHPEIVEDLTARNLHARAVAHLLMTWRPQSWLSVVDLRDAIAIPGWNTLTADGLHFHAEGNAFVASVVAPHL